MIQTSLLSMTVVLLCLIDGLVSDFSGLERNPCVLLESQVIGSYDIAFTCSIWLDYGLIHF